MSLSVDCLRTTPALVALADEWLALGRQSEHDEVVRSPAWLVPWWQVFGGQGGREAAVLTVREHDELVGLVPLLRRPHPQLGLFGAMLAEPLGTGEDEADEVCSDGTGLLARPGQLARVADALGDALAQGPLANVVELRWPNLYGDDPSLGELIRALRRRGFQVSSEQTPGAPHIPLPASWDDYLARLDKSRRYTLKRATRDFAAWSGDRQVLRYASSPAELAEGLAALRALHTARWSQDGHQGVFGSRHYTAFLDDVSARLLALGALELLWLEVDGQPVASAYNIVWGGRVLYYQSGRSVDLPPKLRPGTVLQALAIQRAIAAGHRDYDFLAGASHYKLELALAVRPLVTVRALRPGLPARALRGAELAARLARQLLRRQRQ